MQSILLKTSLVIAACFAFVYFAFPGLADATSTLIVQQGGTGKATFTPSQLLYGNGTNALSSVATTTLSPGTNITFSGGTPVVIGSSPITINGSAGGSTIIPVATSTSETPGSLAYWTSTSATPATLGKVSTTTLTVSGPFVVPSTIGALVGGANATITYTGLATTSQPASSNLLVSNGGAGVYGAATSSLTVNGPLTTSGTIGSLVGGTSLTLGCTTASAGVTGCLSGTDWSTFNGKQSALTFSTGLTNTAGTVTVNTSQSIATLSNLATNGFVKTSGGTGALSIDTSTYLTAAITGLGPLNQVQSGATQTLASSTDSTTGLTSGITITASGNTQTFKPTLTGTLGTTNGGTGATSISTGLTNAGSVFAQVEHPSFSYATSSWSATTTLPLGIGYAQTWNSMRCVTDAGTLNVDLYHGSSHSNFVVGASTTPGIITLSTNTSVTSGDEMQVDIGNPASSPRKITCTVADTL